MTSCNKCFFFSFAFFSGFFLHTPLGFSTVCQVQVVRLKTWLSSVAETTVCAEEFVLMFFTTPTLCVTCYIVPTFIVNVMVMIV
jgi:hypothetical protein